MAYFEHIKSLKPAEFRRLTGVKFETFNKMVEILDIAEQKLHQNRGRKAKLCLQDRLLMTLEYWREYRTIFSLAQSYQIAESSANKAIHWVEDVLSKAPEFKLMGKKSLQNSDMEFEVFVVDATETPIERPKKNQGKKPQK